MSLNNNYRLVSTMSGNVDFGEFSLPDILET